MNRDLRHPRTMQQAFGPYTSHHLQPMPSPRKRTPGWLLALLVIGVALTLTIVYGG